jgi:MoxR-vWA-beta-propeller ternary system domain bpX4
MSLSHFLVALAESGQVAVPPQFAEETDNDAVGVLAEMDRVTRLNLAGTAPEFRPEVALWAARLMHRGCQFLVCRDVDATIITQAMADPCPSAHSPTSDYSADLTFQYLPDLIRMTGQVAAGDPLLQQLLVLARQWPLSSVGVRQIEGVDVQWFISDFALRQLYVDRILAREDIARLGDPRVDHAVREALGAFPELCRGVAERLKTPAAAAA